MSANPKPRGDRSDPEKKKRVMGLRLILFILGGAALGFAYHRFVGCRSGACAITGNPYAATLYGAVMGYLLSGGFR